ncbi:MAG: hypothetical protein WGN25_05390 [Candidatus Electrothrix sp. GW3-4]|uniref:hypothetical protein n=1 Tax=Candidatus Electrothrix sp. GW3-4 TaxID=3126740 RepID=UPI0030CF6ABE
MERKEIEKELERLPKEWVVAFAVRLSAQCLPALLEKKDTADPYFSYWPPEIRSQYLLGVLCLNMLGYVLSTDAAVANICLKAYAYTVHLPSSVAIRTAYFSSKALSCSLRGAYSSARLFSARTASDSRVDIVEELSLLKEKQKENEDVAGYLLLPLWSFESGWYQYGQKFVEVLRNYGFGFDFWAGWYQDRLEGKGLNMELIKAVASLS